MKEFKVRKGEDEKDEGEKEKPLSQHHKPQPTFNSQHKTRYKELSVAIKLSPLVG